MRDRADVTSLGGEPDDMGMGGMGGGGGMGGMDMASMMGGMGGAGGAGGMDFVSGLNSRCRLWTILMFYLFVSFFLPFS
jgi:hypothetical protein